MSHPKRTPTYSVIPDSNSLFTNKPQQIVSPGFEAEWNNCRKFGKGRIEVPAIVVGEILFQKFSTVRQSLENLSKNMATVKDCTGLECSPAPDLSTLKQALVARFAEWLKSVGGVEIPTPDTKIDWKSVVEDAIWRNPPFIENPDSEKGFRDRLVMETVLHLYETKHVDHIAFICGDQILTEATNTKIGKTDRFTVYKSLGLFRSKIELMSKQLEEAFVNTMLINAGKQFYDQSNESGLFYQFEVQKRIETEQQKHLALPPPKNYFEAIVAVGWEPLPESKRVVVGETSLNSVTGENSYRWKTRINYLIDYKNTSSGTIRESTLDVSFDVEWKCTTSDDGIFSNNSLETIIYIDSQFLYVGPMATLALSGFNSPEMQNAMKSLGAALASMPKINLNYLKPPQIYRPTIAGKLFTTIDPTTPTTPEKPNK
jgi:hypothetical protein